jgi:hypothetical protein
LQHIQPENSYEIEYKNLKSYFRQMFQCSILGAQLKDTHFNSAFTFAIEQV